jgi:hypothetical protein
MKPECPISTPIAPPSKCMSAKGITLQGRTSGRPVPIEIEAFAARWSGQAHAFEARIGAAVGDEHLIARRRLLDVRHEAAGAEDAPTLQIFDRQRRRDFVVAGWDIERLIQISSWRGAIGRADRAEAMIERGLQCGCIVRLPVSRRAEAAVFGADGYEIGKEQRRRGHAHPAVVTAVHVVEPLVLTYMRLLVVVPSERM